jgi:serine/threonine-protein kinase RsbW
VFGVHPGNSAVLPSDEEQWQGAAGHQAVRRRKRDSGDDRLQRRNCGRQPTSQRCLILELQGPMAMSRGFDTLEALLHNQASEIPRAHQALDQFAAEHGLSGPYISQLHLALEEHLTNVVSYGYDPGQFGTVRVRFTLETFTLRIEIEDDARPFNPVEAPGVDTSLPLDAKPLGGLGLLMIRKSVDELEYRRVADRNVLTMKKRI